MLLGFLTLYGYFLLFSFVGPPLFTYELVRYRLHLRYQLALAWAFFSIPILFTILTFLDGTFRFAPGSAQMDIVPSPAPFCLTGLSFFGLSCG
jgi:hypothetical protein